MKTTNSSTVRTKKSPVVLPSTGKKSQQAPKKAKQNLGKTVEQQILQTVSGNFNEKTIRTKFVQMVLAEVGAVGVCYLAKNVHDLWAPAIAHPSSGRVPTRKLFDEKFSERCDGFASSANVQAAQLPEMDGLLGLFAPIRTRHGASEMMMVVAQQQSIALVSKLQKIVSALQLWINARDVGDVHWQVLALGSIVELVGKVENQNTQKAACEEAANLLANRIGCQTVALGLVEKGRMRLKAVSGVSKIDRGSQANQNYLQTMVESQTRKESAVFPADQEDNNHLLQAHKQLAAGNHIAAVRSHPLIDSDDNVIGSLIMTGPVELLHSSQVIRFAATAAPAVTNALLVVGKIKRGLLRRAFDYCCSKISISKQLLLLFAVIGFGLLMFVPITYRVRCNGIAEPVKRRFAVAPFDGQIVLGHVEAGDFVKADEMLAEMDGREIRWQLSGVTSEIEQSLRTREIELSDRNVPKTILAMLEYDRLVSEEEVLRYKRDHLQIKSPVDGVVLSGSLERSEAASVKTGQVLFEVGPISPMRIELAVPSEEISQVKVGFPAKVWIDGEEDRPIEGTIKKIHPRSETRDAKNVFIAEIEFPNEDERLRPGMKGSVRIDCEQRSLGWSLFHKPINYMRSRFTWW